MASKREMLDRLGEIFDRWDGLLAGLGEGQAAAPIRPGEWSIRQVITHLWAWQHISTARLEAVLAGGEPNYPAWLAGADPFYAEERTQAFNARIQEAFRGRSWPSLYREWRDGFRRFSELADAVPEVVLCDPGRFPWLGGYAASAVLEGSFEHDQEHWD